MRWLQPRDKEVLKFIYFHRFSSTSQITEIFFKYQENGELQKYPKCIARRRLAKYRDEGLIKSFYTANTDMIHSINEKGVMLVASILNTTFSKLYYNPREDLISIGIANHSLLLNDLYIDLLNHSNRLGGKIIDYKVEVLSRIDYKYKEKNYTLQPDVFMLYQPDIEKPTAYPYFIELDLNTEAPKAYKEKVEKYERYYDSKDYQSQYSTFPKIVTITTNEARLKRLKNYAKTKLRWDYYLFEESEKILRAY